MNTAKAHSDAGAEINRLVSELTVAVARQRPVELLEVAGPAEGKVIAAVYRAIALDFDSIKA